MLMYLQLYIKSKKKEAKSKKIANSTAITFQPYSVQEVPKQLNYFEMSNG